ncbi:ParB/RepB/Spo0J family partition protein [Candidatus Azambacteria bacterium]|nr:ParB/RepB/Spo0J family partition protein [Candidatus Azambacteria bacterium]
MGILGKGLEALIPKKEEGQVVEKPTRQSKTRAASGVEPHKGEAIFSIDVEKISSNPYQPRKTFAKESLEELAASIKTHGILQPLVVTKIEKDVPTGTKVEYQLIAGERRLQAAKLLGFRQVPVVIRLDVTSGQKLELSLIENVQREDLNPLEKARAFERLVTEFGLSLLDIARRVGKSRVAVSNTRRLLNLPQNIQQAIAENRLPEGHARALLMIADPKKQQEVFQQYLERGLTVRVMERAAQELRKTAPSQAIRRKDPKAAEYEDRLGRALGTTVSITPFFRGGRILIKYADQKKLEEIVSKFS